MRVSFALQNLPLVRNSIFGFQKNFLILSQLPQKKGADKISAILPNDFPSLMRLLFHNRSNIFETFFQQKSLHLVFYWQRVLEINGVADIMFFIMIDATILFKAGVNVDCWKFADHNLVIFSAFFEGSVFVIQFINDWRLNKHVGDVWTLRLLDLLFRDFVFVLSFFDLGQV